jgi:hypothetical protein
MDGKQISELRQAGLERQLLKAQVTARHAVDEIKETSRTLRKRTTEVRAPVELITGRRGADREYAG